MDTPLEANGFTIFIPMKIVSEANNREHWTVKNKRKNQLGYYINSALNGKSFPIPACVTFERSGVRQLDDDNLAYAFKGVRDTVAKLIVEYIDGVDSKPKPRGFHDSDPRISWKYKQCKGLPGFYIHIERREN